MEAGVELLGAGGRRADIEAVALAVQAMESCLPGFRMEIGHAGFFRALGGGAPHSPRKSGRSCAAPLNPKNYAALSTLLEGLEDSPAVRAMGRLPPAFRRGGGY